MLNYLRQDVKEGRHRSKTATQMMPVTIRRVRTKAGDTTSREN